MASAAAARGSVTLRVFAIIVVVAGAVLFVVNPWLTGFAAAGLALGWLVRSAPRVIGFLDVRVVRPFRRHPWRSAASVGGVLVVATFFFAFGPLPETEVRTYFPVSYSAQATIDEESGAFAIAEQLAIKPEALANWGDHFKAKHPAKLFIRWLKGWGWDNPQVVAGELMLSRTGRRSDALNAGSMTRRKTLTLPAPKELHKFALAATEVQVKLVAPEYWMLATSPPSDPKALPDGLEERLITFEAPDSTGETVRVELAGPRFRNPLGASLLGLSTGGVAKWGVLLVFAVFQDRLKKLVGDLVERLRRGGRHGATPTPPPGG